MVDLRQLFVLGRLHNSALAQPSQIVQLLLGLRSHESRILIVLVGSGAWQK